jgi:hypothetical protein
MQHIENPNCYDDRLPVFEHRWKQIKWDRRFRVERIREVLLQLKTAISGRIARLRRHRRGEQSETEQEDDTDAK